MTQKKLYSAKEIAQYFGLKIDQILYLMRSGKLKHIRMGDNPRARRFSYAEDIVKVFGTYPNENVEPLNTAAE